MSHTSIHIYALKQVRVSRRHYEIEDCKITCPLACFKAIQSLLNLRCEPVEKFGIITLTTKHKIAGIHVIGVGSLDSVNVEPREVFKTAFLNNAYAIIAFHNHPSGDPEPSANDLVVTRRLKDAGEFLNIQLLDHIIVGDGKYCSLKEMGLV